MSRHIDADKLAMHLADYQYSIPYGCIDESAEDMGAYMAVGECLKAIDEQPSIDLVRCAECRKVREDGGHANCSGYLYCKKWKTLVDEDSYCSWGEREGE